jgi:hypothetical protein
MHKEKYKKTGKKKVKKVGRKEKLSMDGNANSR